MIRNKFLPRSEWEAKLKRWGCRPLEGKGRLNTAEWWIREFPFTVPVEPDGSCEFWAIYKIASDIGIPPDL